MNKRVLIIILLAIAFVLIGVFAVVNLLHKDASPQVVPQNPITFPSVTSIHSATSSISATTVPGIVSIAIQKDQQLTVKDFIHNGITVPDPANPGRYLIAGTLDYCLEGACTAGSETSFNILYDEPSSTFTIALLTEPLGEVRRRAETYLMNTLGITSENLCALNYYIGTTYIINDKYAGDSLGFSMCPGATQLPQ